MLRYRLNPVLRGAVAAAAAGIAATIVTPIAAADSTEDFPIPRRIIRTDCSAEQLLAATRDTSPVYYERYMIDMHNKKPEIQQATKDKMHWFFSLSPEERRNYSENMATNYPPEPLTSSWPNHAKIFFNNKGVVAKSTEVCDQYPRDDQSVWDWPTPPGP